MVEEHEEFDKMVESLRNFNWPPFLLKTSLYAAASIFLQAMARFMHPVLIGTFLTVLLFAPSYIENNKNEVSDDDKKPLYYTYMITVMISLPAGTQFDEGNFKWFLDFIKGYLFSGHSEI